jgi:hypothetical protein
MRISAIDPQEFGGRREMPARGGEYFRFTNVRSQLAGDMSGKGKIGDGLGTQQSSALRYFDVENVAGSAV